MHVLLAHRTIWDFLDAPNALAQRNTAPYCIAYTALVLVNGHIESLMLVYIHADVFENSQGLS